MGIPPKVSQQLLLPICPAQKPSFTLHPTPRFKEVTASSFKSFRNTPLFQCFLYKRENQTLSASVCCDYCLCNITHILTCLPWLFTPICRFPSGLQGRRCPFSLLLYSFELLELLDGYYLLYYYSFDQSWWLHYCLLFYIQQVLMAELRATTPFAR